MQPELSHKEAFKEAARNWGVSDANPQKRVSLVRNRRCIARAKALGKRAGEVKTIVELLPTMPLKGIV